MVDAGKTISGTLAKFVHEISYDDLPQKVRDLAKTRILDALSTAIAGRDMPYSKVILNMVKGNKGNSTIVGCDFKANAEDAMFANSVLVHSIFQEDVLYWSHPDTIIVPVVFTVSEQEHSSGKELLLAILLGYEITARLARAVYPVAMSAFRGGPIMCTVGSGATAGRLMKLDAEKLRNTLGLVASISPGVLNQGWWAGTMEPVIEAGQCTRTAYLAARCARAGATSDPVEFEGRDGFLNAWAGTQERVSAITDNLGIDYIAMETWEKYYPVCSLNQRNIQVALPLAKLGLKAANIEKVVERTWIGGVSYAGADFTGPFVNDYQPPMSNQFTTAAAILGRPVKSFDYYQKNYNDVEVAELTKKFEIIREDGRDKYRFEVYTKDGKIHVAEEETIDMALYEPESGRLMKKFTDLASPVIGEQKATSIRDQIMSLDEVSDVCEFLNQL